MFNAAVAKNIAGIFANVFSLVVLLYPIPRFIEIYKKKKVEDYKAEPYLATLLNCAIWIWYGVPIVRPNSLLILPANAAGILSHTVYLAILFYFSPTSSKVKVGLWFIGVTLFLGIISTGVLVLFHTHNQRSMFVGCLVVLTSFTRILYNAPPAIIKVIKTKSVKNLSFYLSVATFLTGVAWVCYGIIKLDYFSLIANGLVTVSGAMKLIVYGCYYKTMLKDDVSNKEEEEDDDLSKANSQLPLSGNHGQATLVSP